MTHTQRLFRFEAHIDRTKVATLKGRGLVDKDGHFSIFGQLEKILSSKRNFYLRDKEQVFFTKFKFERAQDFGGVYNELMSAICDEL